MTNEDNLHMRRNSATKEGQLTVSHNQPTHMPVKYDNAIFLQGDRFCTTMSVEQARELSTNLAIVASEVEDRQQANEKTYVVEVEVTAESLNVACQKAMTHGRVVRSWLVK